VVSPPAPRLGGVRPSLEAWQRIARPLRAGQGIRLVVYGITGKGKTTGLKEFLDFITGEGLVDLVFVHDVKLREPQYEGRIIHEARDVYTPEHAPDAFPDVVVLRKRNLDHMPSVDGAARVTLESADQGVQTMLLVDEFQRALDEDVAGGFAKGSCNRIASEGRGIGASLVAVKQLPQFMPTGVRSQSDLVFFGVAGDGVTHLVDEKVVDARMGAVLSQLRIGQFVYKPCEGDFDGQVFQVPAPR
jgi:DNA helicase HerA-like ATPase